MFVVAEALEHAEHRFRRAQDFRRRQEFVKQSGIGDHDRGAAAGGDAEAAAAVRRDHRAETEIVDGGHHVIVTAAFERDLELARQRRAQGMTQQESGQRLGIRRDVEAFVGRDAGEGAGGDVAYRVTARFPGRQADVGQLTHRQFDIVELDEMELNILAGGDVTEAARIFLTDIGERVELFRRQESLWNLDAQHLRIAALPLTVSAPHQPERPPLVRCNLTALELFECRDEFVDVVRTGKRQPRPPERFWIVHY